MDALLSWASANKAAPKSALGKALHYLEEPWPYLIRVLEDGRLELSNNLAERSIKPFVIGRKNFLFANTPHGAQGSAVIYSMIETAKAIRMLGEKYGKQAEADALISEYESVMEQFEQDIVGKEHPSVLVLMGLPGTYIECTPNSYVGSLVELAGATSVVQVDDNMNFVAWNTEELLELDPDIILLTAHGLPDEAMEMFAEEFTTNDIWQHFRAVQEGRVYQLDYNLFGMSCTFDWPEALEVLREILYDGTYEAYV